MTGAFSKIASHLRARVGELVRKRFVRAVGVLVGGTAVAQGLVVVVLPLLTRVYTPQDFSVFAVYASLLGILSVAACLRLELAIALPKADEDAANLLAVALCSAATVAVAISIPLLSAPDAVTDMLGQPGLRPFLWMLPIGTWLVGSYTALQYWAMRKSNFSTIAKTRMTQSAFGAGTQLGMGWAGVAPFGLLLGHLIGSGSGVIRLMRDAARQDGSHLRAITWKRMRGMLATYDRFPKYSTSEAVLNAAGTQLPVVIIAAVAIGPEPGYLILAARLMQVPMGLIGGAVAQVYLSRAAREWEAGNLASFTLKILSGLAKSGVGPLAFAGIVAPDLFIIVFGEDWSRAGVLVAWMTPWFVLQILSSPVSMVMHVRQKQKQMLALVFFGFIARVGAVLAVAQWEVARVSEAYALGSALFYLVLFLVVYRMAGCRYSALVRIGREMFLVVSGWVALGLIVRLVARSLIG